MSNLSSEEILEMVEKDLSEEVHNAEILNSLITDVWSTFFDDLEPEQYFVYHYKTIQLRLDACCFIARSLVEKLEATERLVAV